MHADFDYKETVTTINRANTGQCAGSDVRGITGPLESGIVSRRLGIISISAGAST